MNKPEVKASRLRTIHFWTLLVWLIPGAVVSVILRHSLPWTNFMSWYAIIITQGTLWQAARAEDAATPDEDQDEVP